MWLKVFLGHGGIAEQIPYIFGLNEDVRVPQGGDKIKDAILDIFARKCLISPSL